jgi:CheY-like chemotaxis protein
VLSVLIADQDEDTRIILRETLLREGMHIIEASTPDSAREVLGKEHVDLIIVNYPMVLSSGETLTHYLRRSAGLSDIPVLNVSSRVAPLILEKAVSDGVTRTLVKPANITEVVDVVRALTGTSATT